MKKTTKQKIVVSNNVSKAIRIGRSQFSGPIRRILNNVLTRKLSLADAISVHSKMASGGKLKEVLGQDVQNWFLKTKNQLAKNIKKAEEDKKKAQKAKDKIETEEKGQDV